MENTAMQDEMNVRELVNRCELISGERVLICSEQGPTLVGEQDANDFIAAAREHDAAWVVIPTARLHDDFFRLRTRVAGGVVQKFVNYGVKLAIVGDIRVWVADSTALRDFVYETNRGRAFWFVDDLTDLAQRLAAGR